MADLTMIQKSVGAGPAANLPRDVGTVQRLLQLALPPLSGTPGVTGKCDSKTVTAIKEFQRRFMRRPDGRVDPGQRTLFHLSNHRVVTCRNSADPDADTRALHQRVDRILITAVRWLDAVLHRLKLPSDADTREKLRNVFHIDLDTGAEARRLPQVLRNFSTLRSVLDKPPPIQFEQEPRGMWAAWVVPPDPTVHLSPQFFQAGFESNVATIIHELAHLILGAGHPGMNSNGVVISRGVRDLGSNPHDENGLTADQAQRNAYCYGWLARALQPGYQPPNAGAGMTILARPPR